MVKMSIIPKLFYRCNVYETSVKMPTGFFAEIDKLILKFIWK